MIDNTNRNFKGQQKNEVVLCFTRKHWMILVPHIFGFFIGLALVAGFFFIAPEAIAAAVSPLVYRILSLIVITAFTYFLHRFFVRLLNYYLQIMIVTNQRVVQLYHTVYFNRNSDSIDLHEIQDITLHQNGLFRTLLNYGELIITMSSAYASKVITRVPNPDYFFKKINKTKREYLMNPADARSHQPLRPADSVSVPDKVY